MTRPLLLLALSALLAWLLVRIAKYAVRREYEIARCGHVC